MRAQERSSAGGSGADKSLPYLSEESETAHADQTAGPPADNRRRAQAVEAATIAAARSDSKKSIEHNRRLSDAPPSSIRCPISCAAKTTASASSTPSCRWAS